MPDQIIPPPTVFDMAGALDMPAPAEIPDLPSPTPLPAPEYGAYGGQSTEDLLKSNLDKFKQSASQTFDYNSLIQPIRYDDPVYDRLQKSYEGQRGDLFNKLGFFPDINNEDRYARSLTKWQKLGVAMGMVGDLAKDTFFGQWETEADFWKNLSTGKFKQAFLPEYSNEDLLKMNASLERATTENYIPLSSAEQNGEYGFGKLATGIGQFGFTLGTIGAFGTQMALEMGAAALLAPVTEGLSVGVEALSFTNKIKRLFNLTEAYRNLSKFENGVEAANKIKTAYNYVKNTDNIKAGLGKFYGFTKQWNAAVGEAKFEAAGSYADYVNGERLKALQNNRIITYEEQQDMETKAANIAQHNNLTNIALLFAMNKLNMNNVLRGGFGVQRRFISEFGKALEKDILKEGEKYISRFAVKATSKQGLLGMAKGLSGWTLDSAWEGVQEVAQGASGNYWKDYYVNSYDRKSAYDKLNLVGKTVSDKLKDDQSFEEFISGFIIGVPGAAVNRAIGGVMNYGQRGQIKEYKKSVEDYVNKLNEFEKDPLRVFDPRVANLNNQTTFTKMMDDAVKKNDIYAYKNINKEALRDMVMLGIKTGKLDYMIDTLKNQVDTLEDDQFKEIFNISADSTSRKTAKDYVNMVEEEAGYIVKEYDKAKQKFPNPFANMKGIKAGSTEEVDQKIRQVAWEDAVQDLIFEHRNYADTVKRMSSILGDAKEFVGEALYNPFFTMTSSENIDKEINILKQEISADKQAENKTKDITDRIEAKQKQLDALKKWQKSHNLMSKPVGVGMFSESMARYTDEAKAAFGEVLNVFQDQGKASTLTTDSIDKAYNHIIDFMKLQNDNQTAVKNISFLSSPDGFKENYSARNELAKIFYDMEIARRDGVVDKRTKILQALDTDPDFNNLPKVPGLGARLDASMQEREYDDVEDIMNELEDIYDEYTGVKKPEVKSEETTGTSATPESIKNTLDSVLSDGSKTFDQKIKDLVSKGILTTITLNGKKTDSVIYSGRLILFANINGIIQPIYRSSNGTSDKQAGSWYPFFGFGNLFEENKFIDPSDQSKGVENTGRVAGMFEAGWLIKGNNGQDIKLNYEKGHGIPEIQALQEMFNKHASFSATAFAKIDEFKSKGFTTNDTQTIATDDRSVLQFNKEVYGVENPGVYNGTVFEDNKNHKYPRDVIGNVTTPITPKDWIRSIVDKLTQATSSTTAPLSDIDKIKSKNAQLGESILQKLGFKIENRSPNGNVKGGQDGWKIRFNIKNSATGGSYYDDGKSTLVDDAYKDKVFKLVNFLNTYFNTEVSTGSLEKAEELTGKQGYHAFTKDKSNPSSIWKHLAGGEIGESDFTIYIGSADDVLKFISDVRTKHPEILELLHTGNQSGDILIDDIFKGRIEGADIGFSGYHVPTNLNKVIGSDDFIFVHNGHKVIISYAGKALTDITVISEETGKGYKGVFDENMKKDLPELYKNIRNIIGFQLYGKYLTGSNNEFVKLTGVKDADLADVKSRPASSVNKSLIFKKYETKINNAFDKSTLDKLSLEISKNKIGLSEEDKKALLDLIQEKYNTIPSGNEAGMKVFQSYLDALKNITIDQTKTPKEQAADYNEKANSIINTAMADTRLYSSELPDDLVARLFNLANETERSILDGTYTQKKESNFDNVSKQIEEATTADELKKIKKMVDETFTGKELADLTKLIIDKLESMPADETNTDSYPVNETHDFSNVDEFNEDDFEEDINNIVNNNKEETGTEEDDKKNTDYTQDDDDIFDEFKSCNVPPQD